MLGPLQIEILVMISNGLTTKEMAVKLRMKESSVETYRTRMHKLCGVKNTGQLVAHGFKNGYLI